MSRRSDLVAQATELGIKVPFGVSNDALEELIRSHTGGPPSAPLEPDPEPESPETSPEAQALVGTPISTRDRPWDPLCGYG